MSCAFRSTVSAFFVRLCGVAVGLACAGAAGQWSTGGGSPADSGWHYRYDLVQLLLQERGLQPAGTLKQALEAPNESVVVLLGDLQGVLREQWDRLRRFVVEGGAVLIASDWPVEMRGIGRIERGPFSTADPAVQYQSFEDCLQLRELEPDSPLTRGVRSIVLNQSGWLTVPRNDSLKWTVAARLPAEGAPAAGRNQPVILMGARERPFRGVMIVAADQSLFSNGMIWHGDNAVLAIRTVDRLCDGGRSRLFLLSNGRAVRVAGTAPSAGPPIPSVPPVEPKLDAESLLRLANLVADEVQSSNLINEVLRDQPRSMRPLAWMRTILLVLLLTALAWLLWMLMRRRSQMPALQSARPQRSHFAAVSEHQGRTGQFGPAIETLARDLCVRLTGSKHESRWQQLATEQGSSRLRLSGRPAKELSELVSIACQGCREPLSSRRFRQLGRRVIELRKFAVSVPAGAVDSSDEAAGAQSPLPGVAG
jgi:hypothetical protein